MKKNKKLMAGIAGLAVVALIGGTLAYYSATASIKNELSVTDGGNSEFIEEFKPKPDWTGSEVTKVAGVKNTGDTPLLLRFTWEEAWYNANGTKKNGGKLGDTSLDTDPAVTKNYINIDNWTLVDNHYYYEGTLAKDTEVKFLQSIKATAGDNSLVETKTTYYYTESPTEPTESSTNPADVKTKWIELTGDFEANKDTIKNATFRKVADSKIGKEETYTLTITTDVLEAKKAAVDGDTDWKNAFNNTDDTKFTDLRAIYTGLDA